MVFGLRRANVLDRQIDGQIQADDMQSHRAVIIINLPSSLRVLSICDAFEFQKITDDDSIVDCDQYCKLFTVFSFWLLLFLLHCTIFHYCYSRSYFVLLHIMISYWHNSVVCMSVRLSVSNAVLCGSQGRCTRLKVI